MLNSTLTSTLRTINKFGIVRSSLGVSIAQRRPFGDKFSGEEDESHLTFGTPYERSKFHKTFKKSQEESEDQKGDSKKIEVDQTMHRRSDDTKDEGISQEQSNFFNDL